MNINTTYFLILIALSICFSACNSAPKKDQRASTQEIRESMLGVNAILIDAEDQEIKDFISRYGWEMRETGSGLRYMIYEEGPGPRAQKDKIVKFHYSVKLITGDEIYSSQQSGPAEFRLGRGGVESGLEEGVLLLNLGDKARFILPSHLAHGLPGDGSKIPHRATLVYDIQLIDLK